jgi:hypothetical protein
MKIYNNVSTSQLSIAKYYGGLKIGGKEYKYDYANDSLVRTKDLKQYKKEILEVEGAKKPKFRR